MPQASWARMSLMSRRCESLVSLMQGRVVSYLIGLQLLTIDSGLK